jgi:hypothetical protein
MNHFSPELIARISKYFEKKYGLLLTPNEAEEYLHSWASLWRVCAGGGEAAQPPTPPVLLDIKYT